MSYLDIYYRALKDYRGNTAENKECGKQRSATIKANAKDDAVTVVQKVCHVETDWIEAIEEGLVHVEKAIREDRQFIRSQGEVVDIEKVKSVSKDSVKHLAEHSNLITRYTEGEDVIPDRLYIVERLNDYAVYENRFLYMMLCYLRDFITIRYNEIIELEHTYNAATTIHKKIELPRRQVVIDLELKETKMDDPYLAERSTSKQVISRIRDALEMVHAFLATPLMEEVSKVPMVKPPITRTNVLRMNHNFRGALALYEYVSAYDKPGYIVSERVHKISPFRAEMAEEFSEIVLLTSFLTYAHGLDIRANLQEEYEREEERRRREKEERRLEQLKELRRRIQESGESAEEYMLMLEKRNRLLENDRELLLAAQEENEQLRVKIEELEHEVEECRDAIDSLNSDIVRLHNEYRQQIESAAQAHREEVDSMRATHRSEMEAVAAAHLEELESVRDEARVLMEQQAEQAERERQDLIAEMQKERDRHATEKETLISAHNAAIEDMKETCRGDVARITEEWKQKCDESDRKADEMRQLAEKTNEKYEAVLEARRLSDARLRAIRMEQGYTTDINDLTSRAAFLELEYQFEVFKSLFGTQWKKTKKMIRKSTFAAYRQAIREGKDKEFLRRLAEMEDDETLIVGLDAPQAGETEDSPALDTSSVAETETVSPVAETETTSPAPSAVESEDNTQED